jgi:hypothetical protein
MAPESSYVYFISYVFRDPQGDAFANMVVDLPGPITGMNAIEVLQDSLRDNGRRNALVLSVNQLGR